MVVVARAGCHVASVPNRESLGVSIFVLSLGLFHLRVETQTFSTIAVTFSCLNLFRPFLSFGIQIGSTRSKIQKSISRFLDQRDIAVSTDYLNFSRSTAVVPQQTVTTVWNEHVETIVMPTTGLHSSIAGNN